MKLIEDINVEFEKAYSGDLTLGALQEKVVELVEESMTWQTFSRPSNLEVGEVVCVRRNKGSIPYCVTLDKYDIVVYAATSFEYLKIHL